MDYIGLQCSVCGETLKESDDIVVCPECGAPYHRACYTRNGHCVYQEKHGTPDAWHPPAKEEPARPDPAAQNAQAQKTCPRCGKRNAPNALFCDQCGHALTQGGASYTPPYAGQYPPYQNPQQPGQPQPGQPMPFFFDPLGGVKPDAPMGETTAGEIAKVVQNNTNYYIPVFANLQKYKKNRFNFSAFLFSGGWLLYRKQYKTGAAFTALLVAIYALSFAATYAGAPLTLDLMQQAGMDMSSGMVTMSQYMEFVRLVMLQNAQNLLLLMLPHLLDFVKFGIMLYLGFQGNRMYYKHCVKKAAEIQASAPDAADRSLQYQRQGGVNTSLAICLLIGYMILSLLPQMFLY